MALDYTFSDEQELIRENVYRWCKENWTEERVWSWYNNRGMDDEAYLEWVNSDFGKLGFPEEFGGTPCDPTTLCIMVEAMCHATGCAVPHAINTLLLYDVLEFGNEEQIKWTMDHYEKTGKPVFALAVSEPVGGSDNQGMITYSKEEDGKIRLYGEKCFVSNAEHASYFVVVAKEEDPARDNRNMTMWFVPADAEGVTLIKKDKIGNKITPFCNVKFDGAVVENTEHLGERGKGFLNLMKNFEFERCVIAAMLLGEAEAAFDDAAAYANTRLAFGKPIGANQMIQEKLVDMAIKLENVRNMLYKTLWKLSNGISVNKDAAMLKRYASIALTEVTDEAMQIYGGHGFTEDTRVGRTWLDCRGYQYGGGTKEIMAYIVGRMILKENAPK